MRPHPPHPPWIRHCLISMVLFTFTMRRHRIRLVSAPFASFRLAKFGLVPLAVCNAWQPSRRQNLRKVDEISGAIIIRLWTKVHEILRRCSRPSVLASQCLCPIVYVMFHLEDSRY